MSGGGVGDFTVVFALENDVCRMSMRCVQKKIDVHVFLWKNTCVAASIFDTCNPCLEIVTWPTLVPHFHSGTRARLLSNMKTEKHQVPIHELCTSV